MLQCGEDLRGREGGVGEVAVLHITCKIVNPEIRKKKKKKERIHKAGCIYKVRKNILRPPKNNNPVVGHILTCNKYTQSVLFTPYIYMYIEDVHLPSILPKNLPGGEIAKSPGRPSTSMTISVSGGRSSSSLLRLCCSSSFSLMA